MCNSHNSKISEYFSTFTFYEYLLAAHGYSPHGGHPRTPHTPIPFHAFPARPSLPSISWLPSHLWKINLPSSYSAFVFAIYLSTYLSFSFWIRESMRHLTLWVWFISLNSISRLCYLLFNGPVCCRGMSHSLSFFSILRTTLATPHHPLTCSEHSCFWQINDSTNKFTGILDLFG